VVAACDGGPEEGELEVETVSQPVIFGADTRLEYGELTDPRMFRLADATAALFDESDVSCSAGTCSLTTQPFEDADTDEGWKDLCDDVAFKGQEKGAFCTAFLVAPDLMATAGHCLGCTSGGCPPCDDQKVIFGFTATANGTADTSVPYANRYTCVGTPAGRLTDEEDWAVFRIDRAAEGRTPLIVNYSDKLLDDEMMIAGNPDGLPMKVTRNGSIKHDSDPLWFGTNLDAFGGNSGSPVVDYRTGVVDGIHVRRPYAHYLAVSEGFLNKCATENVCSATSGCSPNYGVAWAQETRFSLAAQEVPLHAALFAAVF
jgi:hypothetical protein